MAVTQHDNINNLLLMYLMRYSAMIPLYPCISDSPFTPQVLPCPVWASGTLSLMMRQAS